MASGSTCVVPLLLKRISVVPATISGGYPLYVLKRNREHLGQSILAFHRAVSLFNALNAFEASINRRPCPSSLVLLNNSSTACTAPSIPAFTPQASC